MKIIIKHPQYMVFAGVALAQQDFDDDAGAMFRFVMYVCMLYISSICTFETDLCHDIYIYIYIYGWIDVIV